MSATKAVNRPYIREKDIPEDAGIPMLGVPSGLDWDADPSSIFTEGEISGKRFAEYIVAQEMRVLFCALITAHKRHDDSAFFATVEIAKHHMSKYVDFDDEDWALFRRDIPRKDAP